MKIKRTISAIILLLTITSCGIFKRKSELSNRVALGMTKETIIKLCGAPYKVSAKKDSENNLREILYYKEKTWDDGGWSWSTTVVNHIFVLKNGELIAIEQGDEEHNKQRYNTVFGL